MKNNYESLAIACGAVIFVELVVPVVDSISVFLQSAINKKINKWQMDMQLDQAETEAASELINPSPVHTQAIGFQMPEEPEYYEEDGDNE